MKTVISALELVQIYGFSDELAIHKADTQLGQYGTILRLCADLTAEDLAQWKNVIVLGHFNHAKETLVACFKNRIKADLYKQAHENFLNMGIRDVPRECVYLYKTRTHARSRQCFVEY